VISNIDTYFAVAHEALKKSKRYDAQYRKPKPDGSPGHIITFDRGRKSFKNSLIAIVFAGVYLDALLFIVGTQRLGRRQYKLIKKAKYEERLKRLGCTDKQLLADCERFRRARNEVAHEQAAEPAAATLKELRFAQHEADHALKFIKQASKCLASAT